MQDDSRTRFEALVLGGARGPTEAKPLLTRNQAGGHVMLTTRAAWIVSNGLKMWRDDRDRSRTVTPAWHRRGRAADITVFAIVMCAAVRLSRSDTGPFKN
jgi:hypothetical protein